MEDDASLDQKKQLDFTGMLLFTSADVTAVWNINKKRSSYNVQPPKLLTKVMRI